MKSTFDAASATTLLHFRRLSPSSDGPLDMDDDDRDEDHQGPDNFDETDTNIDDISSS